MKFMKKLPFGLVAFLSLLVGLFGFSSQSAHAETYTIATDTTYAPFEWQDSTGQLTGLDIDILNAIAADQGFDINWQVLGFNAAIQALESGQADGVMAGMVITQTRKETFSMSNAYFNDSGLVIAVQPNSNISSLEDLRGKKVAVKIGTNGANVAQSYADEYGFTLTTFEDSANMYQDVISGNSVAAFEDSAPMSYAIAQGIALKTVNIGSNAASYGFATLKGDAKGLTDKFDQGLANIKANGTYAQIINKYFAGTSLAIDTTVYGNGETYKIATDTTFAPFVWQTSTGSLTGIDMDILSAIAAIQNIKFDISSLGFSAAVQALESGQVDGVIAGMSITQARRQTFDFSDAYYESGIGMAVAKDSDISGYEGLSGKKVAVKTGTQGADFAESIKDQYNFTVNYFEDSANMYQDVISGNSVAAFEDSAVMQYSIKDQGLPLKTVGDIANVSQYGFAVRKGQNETLLKAFNAGLQQIKANGTYDAIIAKYVSDDESSESTSSEDTSLLGIVKTNGSALLSGLLQTLELTLLSIVIALILGVILGLFAVSDIKVLNWIYTIYVDIMRGTPLMVLAFFIYFALPQVFGFKYDSAFLPSLLTLSINAAAYIGELFRGGIQAVDKGQFEAAHSLGLPYAPTMWKIILPQAAKVMVPPFINQFVMTLKDTSILSVIGLVELTQTGKLIIARTYASTNTWIIIALMYIIIITALTKLSKILEKRWGHM